MSFLAAVAAGGTDLDLQTALEFTSDFAFLEMIHRLIVCVFEALCLHRSTGSHPGGATPGKLILGLRVVSCAQVYTKYTYYYFCYNKKILIFNYGITNDYFF